MIPIAGYRFRIRDLPFLALAKMGKILLGGPTKNYLLRPVVIGVEGHRWIWRPKSDDGVAFGRHEPFLMTHMKLDPSEVFLDVGAHVGRYTVRLAKRCRQVIAIEPNPHNLAGLRINLELNRLSNVRIIPFAAWDEEAIITLSNSGAGSTSRASGGGLRVKAIPIDALEFEGRLGLIKIDVEGSEVKVLEGARKTIAKHRPAIIVEVHSGLYGEHLWKSVVKILTELGYGHEEIGRIGGSVYLLARSDKHP